MMNKSLDTDMASKSMARLCAVGCGVLGLWGLACWALDQPLLSSVFSPYIPMSPQGALGELLIGSALFWHAHRPPSSTKWLCVVALAVIAIVGGGLGLGESLIHLGSHSPANVLHAPARFSDALVARMSGFSAVSLLLGGAGLLLLSGFPAKRWAGLAAVAGTVIGAVNGVVLLAYFYGAPLLYNGTIRPVPLLGAIALFLLGLGLVAATSRDRFPVSIFVGPTVRARLLRVFLPITFLVVLLDELLLNTFHGYSRLNPALQDGLETLVSLILVTGAVAYVAGKLGRRLDAAEAERDQSEQALRQARDDLERRVQERTATLVAANEDLSHEVALRRQSETALFDSERKLRLIAENTTDVIFAFDMQRRPLFINSAVKELTGYTFAEIRQRGFVNWIHPDDQPRMLKHWVELYVGKGYSEVEFRLVTKTGQVKWCSSTWGPIFDESGHQIGVQGRERDITERKLLEGELLEISAKERQRVGHDLHDGLGQYLAGIALKAKVLEDILAEEHSSQARSAKTIVELINQAIRQTRSLARGLDPVHVEADGLVPALSNLAAQTKEMFRLDCTFTCPHERLPVNTETSLALYRITQEAIHNAVVHAQAPRIDIQLALQDAHLLLTVRDSGKGFPPGPQAESGMGLHIMHYRARSIGGSLTIDSAPETGTVVSCSIPKELCLRKDR